MAIPIRNYFDLVTRTYELARPFGRVRLAVVCLLSFIQGIFQVVGVSSVGPFFIVASDPSKLRTSKIFGRMLSWSSPVTDSQLLMYAGLFAILMLLVANLLNIAGEFVRNRYAQQYGHWLRLRLINKIAARPYADFLQENTGILLKKVLADVNTFTSGILLNLLDTATRLMTVLLLLGALFAVQPQIAIFGGVGLVLFYGLFFKALGRWRAKASRQLKEASRGSYVQIQQLLGGIKPVKVHRAESYFIERYGEHSAIQAKYEAMIPVIGATPRYLVEPLAFGGLVAAVLVFVARGQNLTSILPSLTVMALAGYRLLPAIQLLWVQINSLSTSRHSMEEIYDEFQMVELSRDREEGAAEGYFGRPESMRWSHSIKIKDLLFCYPGAPKPVIRDFNLEIPKNTSLGIVGHTGSGKSTLVDLILGLHVPTAGEILVDDLVLGTANRRAWRGGIGYVPQDIYLLDDTITANIAFGVPEPQVDLEAVKVAAKAAQIHDFIAHELTAGFDTIVGERGVRLSGGQRQRIGLARALYHRPELLILDEATSALDIETEAEVMKAINSLHGSITILIIAHRLTTIENCTHKVRLGTSD